MTGKLIVRLATSRSVLAEMRRSDMSCEERSETDCIGRAPVIDPNSQVVLFVNDDAKELRPVVVVVGHEPSSTAAPVLAQYTWEGDEELVC